MLGKTFRSFVAVILAVCLVFSSVGTVFAAENDSDPISYVSLGDSMTNGYGLDGYDGNTGAEDYGTKSYANQFAEWLGAEHAQLAMSAMRAEDLHWLLEVDYEDPAVINVIKTLENGWNEDLWYSVFTNGDIWTWDELVNNYRFDVAAYCIEGEDKDDKFSTDDAKKAYSDIEALRIVAKYTQESVKNADIISLGMGNGNFGVFMFGRILEAIGFDGEPSEAMVYDVENAILECDAEIQAKIRELMAELNTVMDEYLGGMGFAGETVDALKNTVLYTAVSYVLNYAGSVEAILQLNPDAEIIQVALMNTYKSDEVVEGITIGDLLDVVFIPLNAYIAALPTYMQATQNGVYADAKFYYAEAPYVECLVDEYGLDFEEKGADSLIRDRFVQSIIVDEDGDLGMVWDLMKDVKLVGDITLTGVSLGEIVAYEKMSDAQKAAYAQNNTQKAVSIAVYLAFEDAVIASKNSPVTLDSVMGLGGLGMDVFGGVMDDFKTNIVTNAAAKSNNAATGLAGVVNENAKNQGFVSNVTATDILTIYVSPNKEVAATDVANTIANDEANAAIIKALAQTGMVEMAWKVKNPDGDWDEFKNSGDYADYAADVLTGASENDKENAIATAKAKVVETFVSGLVAAAGNVDLLCMLFAVPETLSASLQKDTAVSGLLALFARCVIGNGLGGHPSAAGHDALYEAVKTAYEEEYTSADKTTENLITAAAIVKDLVVEYYDEAYAYAYAEAKNAGYIDTAIAGIDSVIATLENIDLSKSQMTDEFKAELAGEIEEVIETLNTAKVLIDTADVLDQATLDALIATLDEAGEAVENLQNLLTQAGEDVNDLIVTPALNKAYDKLVNEVIPAAKETVNQILTDAYNYLVEKLDETGKALKEAYDAFVKAAVEAVKETAPEVADWIYDWLYNNPEKVIAFFAEYGDDMVAFLDEYKEEAAAVIAYLVANFGDEVAEFVMDNADEILTTMVEWLEVHGENTWELILVYLQELGVIDAINEAGKDIQATLDKLAGLVDQYLPQLKEEMEAIISEHIDDLKAAANELIDLIKEELQKYAEEVKPEIEAAIKDLQNQLDELKKELADKKAELENAADELKAEIQKAIDELEAKIEEVEAAIDELEAKLAELAEKLEAVYEAALGLDDAIEKMIEEGIDAAVEELQNALTNVAEAIKEAIAVVSEEVAEKFQEIADTILNALEELYDGATSDKYIVAKNSYYVALGDGTAVSESYVDMLAEELGLSDRYVNLAQDGDLFADIYDVLAENTAEIEKADLVTVGYGSNSFINYAIDNVLKGVMTGNVTQPDWTTYVGEEGLPYVVEALAEVKAYFDEQNLGSISILGKTADMAELMTAIVESYAYAAASYACDLPEVINAIHEINPNAVVIIVGMYNPLEGIEIQLGETSINVGKYVDYLVEAANVHNFAYALLTDNAIFVEAEDVETQNEKTVMTVDEFLGMYLDLYGEFSGEALNPSEAGHKYIQEQILDALTVRSAFEIEFARLQLGNSLAMDFAFKQDVIAADDEYYVQVTKTYNDGRADKVVKYTQDEWKTAEISGTDYYYVRFTGVAAKEMADDVYVQVFTADGKAASEVYTCSIRDYAMRAIKPENNDETNALYVDMLNYGAAAQDYFDYNADDLANNELTAEQKEYATDSISVTNNLVKGENYNASALDLANSLKLKLRFDNIDSSMYAVVSFTNHLGREVEETIDGSEFQSNGTVVVVDQIVAADACEMITCTVYDSEGNAVATVQDSVESYIARTVHGHEVYTAVMKFTIAAHNYFH